jgi:hypothetical protein
MCSVVGDFHVSAPKSGNVNHSVQTLVCCSDVYVGQAVLADEASFAMSRYGNALVEMA